MQILGHSILKWNKNLGALQKNRGALPQGAIVLAIFGLATSGLVWKIPTLG